MKRTCQSLPLCPWLLLLGLPASASAKPWWMRGIDSNETDFLPPDVAFRVGARVDGNILKVRWVIADGYYLYRQKIEVRAESPDLVVAAPQLPTGLIKTDPYLGTQEIYHAAGRSHRALHPLRRRRPSPANQSDLSGLRRSRPLLSAHHQSDFSERRRQAGRSRQSLPHPWEGIAILARRCWPFCSPDCCCARDASSTFPHE